MTFLNSVMTPTLVNMLQQQLRYSYTLTCGFQILYLINRNLLMHENITRVLFDYYS